jgi:hypothetical protein
MATETNPNPNGVIYLEVDEDITSAIDKLTKSAASSVQIVTAKRSTLFQSVINLRLLQKAAKDSGKKLVLVTGDRVATSLAGRVGVAVASQVGEAAKVPSTTPLSSTALADDEIDGGAIGAIAKSPDTPLATPAAEAAPLATAAETPSTPAAKTMPKPKGSKVPNIGKMQKRLVWGGLVVLIVVVLIGLNYFLSSAQVTLYAQGSQVNSTFDFTADPTITSSSTASSVLTAQQLTQTKTLNATVTASGTKDDGSKASGTMTIYNCYDSSSHDIPAGTVFTAGDGNTFVSTGDVTVPGGGLSHGSLSPGQASVGVQASANGVGYNESPGTYTIAGEPSGSCSGSSGGIYGQGSQMQGGVTKIDKVITQSDVTQAENAALSANKSTAMSALSGKANNQQVAISQSFQQSVSSSTANPVVGSVASSGSLAIQVSYTELAVAKSDLSALAESQESQQLGAQNQIYDDGSDDLQFTSLGQPQSSGAQKFKAAATAYAGTKINTTALAQQLKGKKEGDAESVAGQVSGVTRATVSLSPGWVTSVPKITSHIHISIKVSNPSGS